MDKWEGLSAKSRVLSSKTERRKLSQNLVLKTVDLTLAAKLK